MIRPVEANFVNSKSFRTLSFSTLKGAKIGIDANNYIDNLVKSHPEPLVQALGGFPFALLDQVSADLAAFRAHNITPFFVFDGLSLLSQQPVTADSGKRETSVSPTGLYSTSSNVFSETTHILQKRSQAWDDYEKGRAEQAVHTFDQATSPSYDAKKQNGVRTLINFFRTQNPPVEFVVAPYTASAQLVYFYTERFIDAIAGSFDVFLWPEADKLITNFDHRGHDGHGSFTFITKRQILSEIQLPHELYVDACILSGSVGFSPYSDLLYPGLTPQLLHGFAGGPAAAATAISSVGNPVAAGLYAPFMPFKVAASLIANSPTSVYQIVQLYSEQQESGLVKYVEKYQKTLAAIMFQPVLKDNGKVEPSAPVSEWPKDIHEIVGQRLPDEIYFYLAHGLIGPELLNCLTSGYLFEPAPLDGGRPTSYRRFVGHIQDDVQSKAFNYVSLSLHRYFQSKPVKLVSWFEPSRDQVRRPGSIDNILKKNNWSVTFQTLEGAYALNKKARYQSLLGKLLCLFYESKDDDSNAVQEFMSNTFPKAPKSLSISGPSSSGSPSSGGSNSASTGPGTPVSVPSSGPPSGSYVAPSLYSVEELIDNAILRDLQTIGLLNSDHHLTPWGKVIAKALDSLETDAKSKEFANPLSESLLLALLLVRDGFLTASPLEPGYPVGSNEVKVPDAIASHILLLGRLASYVSLSHKPTGFSGPLSRTILAFGSIIARQYSAYRQLIEATVVSLLATGESERISLKLTNKELLEGANSHEITDVWDDIAPLLPFAQAPNCGTGVAMKMYLERAATSDSASTTTTVASTTPTPTSSANGTKPGSAASSVATSGEFTKAGAIEDLRGMFRQSVDVEEDLKKAFTLWREVYNGVLDAEKAGLLTTSAAISFHEAQKWVESYAI